MEKKTEQIYLRYRRLRELVRMGKIKSSKQINELFECLAGLEDCLEDLANVYLMDLLTNDQKFSERAAKILASRVEEGH
jgi:hypothetical protein